MCGATSRFPSHPDATGRIRLRNKRRFTPTNGAWQRGQRLLRRRGEFLERPFAHQYETGGLRRVHVRGRSSVAKRVLRQAAACNLALLLRSLCKAGTPRGLADLHFKLCCALWRVLAALRKLPTLAPRRKVHDHQSNLAATLPNRHPILQNSVVSKARF